MENLIQKEFERVTVDEALKFRTLSTVMKRENKNRAAVFGSRMKLAVSAACIMLFVVLGVGGYGVYYTEAAAVSVDINPSVELSLNCFGRIVATRAFDSESQKLLDSVKLTNLTYNEGLEKLLTDDVAGAYLADGSVVTVTLETKNSAEDKWMERLETCINQTLSSHHSGATAEYGSVTSDMREEAHQEGISMGKYCAIQEVLEEDKNATIDELKELKIDEIKTHKDSCGHDQYNVNESDVDEPNISQPITNDSVPDKQEKTEHSHTGSCH